MITKFEANSFENCANITVLDLSYNLIDRIPRNTFDENTYATELKLSYNLLTNLSHVNIDTVFRFLKLIRLFTYDYNFVGTTSQYDRFENPKCIAQSNIRHTEKHISKTL